jgi:hypothetical protein
MGVGSVGALFVSDGDIVVSDGDIATFAEGGLC